jgi:hypothetical protein
MAAEERTLDGWRSAKDGWTVTGRGKRLDLMLSVPLGANLPFSDSMLVLAVDLCLCSYLFILRTLTVTRTTL